MARDGITRQMVKNAKTALVANGHRPTIYAVRKELGNTGSNTTISRYLKELEESPKNALDRLSEPLVRLIQDLSVQLQEEAEEKLIKARAQFAQEKNQLLLQLTSVENDLEQYQQRVATLEAQLKNEQQTSQPPKSHQNEKQSPPSN